MIIIITRTFITIHILILKKKKHKIPPQKPPNQNEYDMCRFARIRSSDCLFYTCLKHTLFGEYHFALTKRKK